MLIVDLLADRDVAQGAQRTGKRADHKRHDQFGLETQPLTGPDRQSKNDGAGRLG